MFSPQKMVRKLSSTHKWLVLVTQNGRRRLPQPRATETNSQPLVCGCGKNIFIVFQQIFHTRRGWKLVSAAGAGAGAEAQMRNAITCVCLFVACLFGLGTALSPSSCVLRSALNANRLLIVCASHKKVQMVVGHK